ncbi:hypothetical protein SynBIOSE41_03722 [Synechococcus sp. BIOS-E4-1]|uniref:hypothetical protein n=1 Tax=Synechococcus sp. BIOS-E4-1 TaxID=1400864 RepID=UPI0016490501|nr:hypothetical protein [Synechococcus sp. BIOS-E4-1]QNI56191.1 hypothetical protein SynBIOSE41_03722 [Synechococcus sp. BIOS-E4-1]
MGEDSETGVSSNGAHISFLFRQWQLTRQSSPEPWRSAELATVQSSAAQSNEGNDDDGGADGLHGVLLSEFTIDQMA